MQLYEELVWRGLVQESSEGLGEALETPLTLYVGYDPTAPSLHAGNLQQIITMRRFQLRGHRVIALAGGGTGLIGDPSGKSAERALHDASRRRASGPSGSRGRSGACCPTARSSRTT